MQRSQKGFTLVEMLVVIAIIGILASLAIPNMAKARMKAKEAEVKANLHVIQAALERFYVDHSQYPAYIGGGDSGGWARFKMRMRDISNEDAYYLNDPLIDQGYINPSYPLNPFVDQQNSINVVTMTGGNGNAGSGDPRFGAGGDIVGNCLDDPRFLSVFTIGGLVTPKRTLPNGVEEPFDVEQLGLHWMNSRIGESTNLVGQLNYISGGNVNETGEVVNNWWPGNFFYRAMGDLDTTQMQNVSGTLQVFNFRYHKFTTYMLGGYGSIETKGKDVIRTVLVPGQTVYSKPRPDLRDIAVGLPEVFGGGDKFTHPVFPPKDIVANDWIYGAPDGYYDGVVEVLTGSGSSNERSF
jgi:prepilin-type N-terminal cleavage/methylation domain-containing protein